MIGKEYHATAILSLLAMLLLLGLHLLGFGLANCGQSSSSDASKVAASSSSLARNSSPTSFASSLRPVYQHPISLETVSGAKIDQTRSENPNNPLAFGHLQPPTVQLGSMPLASNTPRQQVPTEPAYYAPPIFAYGQPEAVGGASAAPSHQRAPSLQQTPHSSRPTLSRPKPQQMQHMQQMQPQKQQQQQQPQEEQPPSSVDEPSCARAAPLNESSHSANFRPSFLPVLLCLADAEYPTREVMRALETFALERGSIEQVLPQQLVQLLLAAPVVSKASSSAAEQASQLDARRQLLMDSLQASVVQQPSSASSATSAGPQLAQPEHFPSEKYAPMCQAASSMVQPRRARNLLGHWRVVVNLPGLKYRGVAVSQMVRLDECSRPEEQCSAGPQTVSSGAPRSSSEAKGAPNWVPNSACLQHYQTQRLLVWSAQQGLHVDLFRFPSSCSCHLRR